MCFRARSVASVIGNRDVTLFDCFMDDKLVGSKSNIRSLRKNGIISHSHSYADYKRYLCRILLNPSIELQKVIQNNKQLLFTRKHVLGVQVRMGGCLADFHEIAQMMTMDQLRAYPNTIVTMMHKWHLNPNDTVIYLSTDSSYAEKFIRQKLGSNYEIAVSKTFKRSHSRNPGNDEPVKNALVDLYLLSDSDAMIVCYESTFGLAALAMTRAKHTMVYMVTHSLLNRFNPKTGHCG